MSYDWTKQFKAVYAAGLAAYQGGARGGEAVFDADAKAFLASIGCTPTELYDFIDDFVRYGGDPDFETCLLVTAIRRDYFLNVLGGKWSGHTVPMSELPAKRDAVDGIEWLPRIIEKAKIKLRGEMDPDLMYGCAGDRSFLRKFDLHLADLLRFVWDANGDDRKVIEFVKAHGR